MDKFLIKTKRKQDDVKEEDTKKVKREEKESKQEDDNPAENETEKEKSIVEWLTLPVADLKTNQDYEKYFTKLADLLLNKVVLQVNGKPHRLAEIEFYFTNSTKKGDNPPVHQDPFTHCDDVQKLTAKWYFHRTNRVYRTGTYKGLDITIGQGPEQIGGILIRSIESIDTFNPTFVCGPCKSVDHILEVCKVDSIPTLVDEKMKSDLSVVQDNSDNDDEKETSKKILYLEKSEKLQKRKVYTSARVGLHMTKGKIHAERQKIFVFKHYRFFTNPKKVFKGSHYMTVAMHHQGILMMRYVRPMVPLLTTFTNKTELYHS